MANVNRGKNTKAYKPSDFMPKEKKAQTPQQMLNTIKALNKLYGGTGGD